MVVLESLLSPSLALEEVRRVSRALAAATMDLLEIQQKRFERTAGRLEPRLLQKMAHLCLAGVRHCQGYLDTLGEEGVLPPRWAPHPPRPPKVP